MIKTLLKLGAYRKAPRLTFAALHPLKLMKLAAVGSVAMLLLRKGKK